MGKAIGIDFGTTNTVVSWETAGGNFKQLKLNGKKLVPSVIYYDSQNDWQIGQIAARKLLTNPSGGMKSFKTLLQTNEKMRFIAGNGNEIQRSPQYITYNFLHKVFSTAQEVLLKEFGNDGIIESVVVTVPTGFNDVAKSAIREAAARAAGIDKNMVRREYEPTAAAIAAMRELGPDAPENLLVYDFGGGTFDISLIKKENGVYKEKLRDGDVNLGGNLLTKKIMGELLEMANEEFGLDLPMDEDEFDEETYGISEYSYKVNMQDLFKAANDAKEELSESSETDVSFNWYVEDGKSEKIARTLTRDFLERLIRPEVLKTVEITARLLKEAEDNDVGAVDRMVLAGGSSNIPMIRDMLEKRFPNIQISLSANASTIISCGAAILARNLENLDHMTSHVTSCRMGVSVTEGMRFNKFHALIDENQPLPCEGSCDFNLARDGQDRLDIHYYEYDVKKNPRAVSILDDAIQEVDVLHIRLPPDLKKDETVVNVRFIAKKDGSLEMQARITDLNGKMLKDGQLSVNRESDMGW